MSAFAVFLLAFCSSLQTVPLEMPIFFPASSCDNPSKSTSLRASSSALSIEIGSRPVCGFGVRPVIGGSTPTLTGLGNLPLLPRLLLRPCLHIDFAHVLFLHFTAELLYISVHSLTNINVHKHKIEVKQKNAKRRQNRT